MPFEAKLARAVFWKIYSLQKPTFTTFFLSRNLANLNGGETLRRKPIGSAFYLNYVLKQIVVKAGGGVHSEWSIPNSTGTN